MSPLAVWLALGLTALACVTIAGLVALRGFLAWLDYKRAELTVHTDRAAPPTTGQRIDVADLKERVRKLEAIAAGVDF